MWRGRGQGASFARSLISRAGNHFVPLGKLAVQENEITV